MFLSSQEPHHLNLVTSNIQQNAPDTTCVEGSSWPQDVPEVQGIPIPKQKWLRWDRLLHTLLACLLLCLPLFQKRQLKEERFLPANKLALEVSNCHVSVQDADKPGVILQHWLFMGSIKERRSNGTLRLVATMQPRLSSWFRCNLAVLAPGSHTNETMKALDVTVSNSERPTAVLLAGGLLVAFKI